MLVKKPAELTFEQAAAIPMAASTALQGLRDLGQIRPGQKVLIYGAGGGVGNFAVQLAKYYGTTVTAVCGTHNVELVRSLGADRVVDYTREDITTSGETFDLILGVNGYQPLSTYRRMLVTGRDLCRRRRSVAAGVQGDAVWTFPLAWQPEVEIPVREAQSARPAVHYQPGCGRQDQAGD